MESILRCDDCNRSLETSGACAAWCRYSAPVNAHYELVKSVGGAFMAQNDTFFSQDVASAMDSLGNIGMALEQDAEDDCLSASAAIRRSCSACDGAGYTLYHQPCRQCAGSCVEYVRRSPK